jgi:hypothetical protein
MKTFLRFFFVFTLVHSLHAQSDSLAEIRRQIQILTEEIERMKLGEADEQTDYSPSRGLGAAASKVYSLKKSGASLAGYGEVLYQNYSKDRDDNVSSTKLDQLDYLRNIIYVGYRYNDWILFNSEVEFEHASTGKGGSVSVEFGYVELMFSNHFNFRAGMVLPPMGITNEKHEPSLFLYTQRPQVEQLIIPSTWRTNGFGAYGEIVPSLNYSAYIVEGFLAKSFSDADGVRGGRQSGAFSIVEDFGVTGKLEYNGINGTILGASFYTGNSGQGAKDSLGVISALTSIISAHAEFVWNGLEARALFARSTVDQAGRVSKLAGKTIGSEMSGYYASIGYDIIPHFIPGSEHALIPFIFYEAYDTHAAVAAGFTKKKDYDRTTTAVGLSYKPHPNVAFKFDYRDHANAANTGNDQWNMAVNYLF